MPKPVRSSEGIKELFSAVDRGSLHFVEQSLIQHPDIINERNKYGYTALHLATQKSYLDIVKLLLKYEANPNILGGDIYTALEEAAEKGNLEVVNLLIENGANVEREKIFLPDLDLQSIGLAAKNGHLEVSRFR